MNAGVSIRKTCEDAARDCPKYGGRKRSIGFVPSDPITDQITGRSISRLTFILVQI